MSTNAITKTIDDLHDHGHLRGADLANIVQVSKATVSRWSSGKVTPRPQKQLILSDLRYVVDRLSEFYTPDETRAWLYSKNNLLNGERAIELINEDRTDEVLTAIESFESTAYL